MKIADQSACMNVSWKDRGKAPKGYIRGMALTFAKSLCWKREVMAQELGDASKDALAWYGLTGSPGNNTTTRLIATYTLLTGLGMRESSGKYCEGWDKSASHGSASEYEAGLFQFSSNSLGASKSLPWLYDEYSKYEDDRCLLEIFQEGASCKVQDVGGTGAGAEFQSFAKRCPAFAVEYAASLIRTLRKHFGPLNRKEAEYNIQCEQMFTKIAEDTGCK